MGVLKDKEPPSKRAKTLADNPSSFSGTSSQNNSSGELMEQTLGSKGLIKKSEFIRIITDALNWLGFDKIGARLEEESGISLHSPVAELFLKQVKDGEWDKSIDTLHGFELRDEKAVKFLLLEQKFFEFLQIEEKVNDAIETLRDEIVPLGVNMKRVHELASKVILGPGEDTESVSSRSNVVEKLQKLFPPAVIIPERRLEYLLEKNLDFQRNSCVSHNIPDSELFLCSDHHCCDCKIPSETVQTLEGHTDEVWFLKFSHNGKYLASSSKDKSAIIWEINEEGKFLQKHKLVGHENPVVSILWSPDDTQVITCGEKEVIRRWNVDSGEFVQLYERNGVGSVSCGWLHDGSGVIGGIEDKRIYLWNLDGTEIQHEQGERAQKLSDVAMTSDGKWLVSVHREHEISLFDRETGVQTLFRAEDMITSFSLSKDNKYLLINLITQKIHLWSIEGKPYKALEFTAHKRSRFIIRSCFGGYEESFIASGSEDSRVYIWNIKQSMKPCRVLLGHSGAVNCVSWNPNDLYMLASASDDGTIRIWGLDKKLK